MTDPKNESEETNPTGRDDPTDWQHTGVDTLRDPRGGTYGTARGQDDPENVKEYATPHEKAQSGADVRPDAESMPETLPECLQRKRTAPGHKPEHTDHAVSKGDRRV